MVNFTWLAPGWQEFTTSASGPHVAAGWAGGVQAAGVAERCGAHWGGEEVCGGHMLWSPGLGGRVLMCLQSSDPRVVGDGTMVGLLAGGLLDLVNRCLLIS